MMRVLGSLFLVCYLGGCASVFMSDNEHSTIRVTASCGSIQNIGGRCRISGSGVRAGFELPAEIQITNSWSPLTIECEGDLLGSVSTFLMPKPNWGLAGNALVGGLPGAMIDTATGKGLNYNRSVNLHQASCLR